MATRKVKNLGVNLMNFVIGLVSFVVFFFGCIDLIAEETKIDDVKSWSTDCTELLKKIKSQIEGEGFSSDPVFKNKDGVAPLVFKALSIGALYEGQPLGDFKLIFGEKSLIRPFDDDNKFIMIPLLTSNEIEKKRSLQTPGGAGAQWYLFFRIKGENVVGNLSLRHTTLKQIIMGKN